MTSLKSRSPRDHLVLAVAMASALAVAGVEAHQHHGCCGHHHHGCAASCGSCGDCRADARGTSDGNARAQAPPAGLCSFLLDNRLHIRRSVVLLRDGIEAQTESDDPALVEELREHVVLMAARAQGHRLSPPSDPLFAELLRNVDEIVVVHERTPQGIRVAETSRDPYVARLIQAYAEVVTLILWNGPREAAKRHPVPVS